MDAVRQLYSLGTKRSRFIREGRILTPEGSVRLAKITLDTGADSGNYIGREFLKKIANANVEQCQHNVIR